MVKYTQTIRRVLQNCLSVFENFVGLALKKSSSLSKYSHERLLNNLICKVLFQSENVTFTRV